MRRRARCALCGLAFLKGDKYAAIGPHLLHRACVSWQRTAAGALELRPNGELEEDRLRRRIEVLESDLRNARAERANLEEAGRVMLLRHEQEVQRHEMQAQRAGIALGAAQRALATSVNDRLRAVPVAMVRQTAGAGVTDRERIYREACASDAVGKGIWGLARYMVKLVSGFDPDDATVQRFALLEIHGASDP